jgi:hypothetical protein
MMGVIFFMDLSNKNVMPKRTHRAEFPAQREDERRRKSGTDKV